MKKLFSTLGMMAMVSLCLFSSCKDEDYPATETQTNASANAAQVKVAETAAATNATAEALAAAKAAAAATGATVTQDATTGDIKVTNTDGTYSVTTVETSYSYQVGEETFDNIDAAMAALSKLPAGSTATVVATLTQTTTTQKYDASGNKVGSAEEKKETATTKNEVKIPEAGEQPKTSEIQLPTSVTDTNKTTSVDVTVTTTEKGQHSGGGIK